MKNNNKENRTKDNKHRIVWSVIVFLLVVALISITYAYFITQIQGNNKTSIDIETANLTISYDDLSDILAPSEKFEPGTVVGEKYFNVENFGENNSYVVTLEIKSVVDANNNNTTFVNNDFYYTLTCDEQNSGNTCNGLNDVVFPLKVGKYIIADNEIAEDEIQEYKLTLVYRDTDTDQSIDMNKTFTAKIDIADFRSINPFSIDTNSLAYNIVNNAVINQTGTSLVAFPSSTPGAVSAGTSVKELTIEPDDYGMSYYYRGGVTDNYVNFAGMCWRIVRVEGDGAVKLILENKNKLCQNIDGHEYELPSDSTKKISIPEYPNSIGEGNYGYSMRTVVGSKTVNYRSLDYEREYNASGEYSMYGKLQNWLTNSNINTSKLKTDKWCLGDITNTYDTSGNKLTEAQKNAIILGNSGAIYYYEAGLKVNSIAGVKFNLMCNRTGVDSFNNSKIGALTVDEVALAGGVFGSGGTSNSYLYDKGNLWGLLSAYGFNGSKTDSSKQDLVLRISSGNYYYRILNYINSGTYLPPIRPAITLIPYITITGGNGTKANPYVVQN